jgi:hypothetical protein
MFTKRSGVVAAKRLQKQKESNVEDFLGEVVKMDNKSASSKLRAAKAAKRKKHAARLQQRVDDLAVLRAAFPREGEVISTLNCDPDYGTQVDFFLCDTHHKTSLTFQFPDLHVPEHDRLQITSKFDRGRHPSMITETDNDSRLLQYLRSLQVTGCHT